MNMRIWKNNTEDDGSIHCLGNGKMCVYEQGPNIIQVFGPPYSTPSIGEISINDDCPVESQSCREPQTAMWTHYLYRSGKLIGSITDFIDSVSPSFLRKVELTEPISFIFELDKKMSAFSNKESYLETLINDSLLIMSEAGLHIYSNYPTAKRSYYQLFCSGNSSIKQGVSGNTWKMTCLPGESLIYITGGPGFDECYLNSKRILKIDYKILFSRTEKYWKEFSGSRFDFNSKIKDSVIQKDAILKSIDDVSIIIKTQQGEDGGVLAGHCAHLGYIRDQYGVCRCLLTLGYFNEAKIILDFYWNIWQKYKTLHNAQGIGVDGIFHIHENDRVEITGYVIIMAFDYLRATHDNNFINVIFPMLEWAWNMQKGELINYMLPFNGDETYIAGGILPRSCMFDGSAEATLLFITSGENLLKWLNSNKRWDSLKLAENIELLQQTKQNYRSLFMENNIFYTNNPLRVADNDYPELRYGICEACFWHEWTIKSKNNRFLCPKCINKKELPYAEKLKYVIQSVSLVPYYIGSEFFNIDEIKKMSNIIIDDYNRNGNLPSRPEGGSTVGYDYGLLLYTLVKLNSPVAQKIFEETLSITDQTGAWSEYYNNGKPYNTRYRPWESGVNLDACIQYVLKS